MGQAAPARLNPVPPGTGVTAKMVTPHVGMPAHTTSEYLRSVCQVNPQEAGIPESPLFPLLDPKLAQLPSCSESSPNASASIVNQRSAQWTTREVTTSSKRFSLVPGLSELDVCASDEITVTVSVELDGAPAGFRVRIDRREFMEPGAVRFVPAGPHDSFSFTFAQDLGPLDGLDRHVLQLQWRSPFRIATSLERGTILVRYEPGFENC